VFYLKMRYSFSHIRVPTINWSTHGLDQGLFHVTNSKNDSAAKCTHGNEFRERRNYLAATLEIITPTTMCIY